MALLLFALIAVLLAQSVSAQTGACIQLGGGFTSCSDNTGRQATIIDMGGGFQSYSDNKGNSGSIIDMGGGFKQFNINPGTTAAPPPPTLSPRTQIQLGMPPMPAMPGMPAIPPAPLSPITPPPYGVK